MKGLVFLVLALYLLACALVVAGVDMILGHGAALIAAGAVVFLGALRLQISR